MGEVYLAYDTHLARKVALKLLPAEFTQDEHRIQRFQQEDRAVSALNHPNIITIYEIGKHDSTYFIATEFIEGITLRQKLANGPLPLRQALDIACQAALALTVAHEANIIHRDIKPENIINSLSHVPNLRMIARSTVFRYKGRETDPQTVGRELGVQAILTGRVVQRGDDLLISAELVDVNNNFRSYH